MWESQYAHAAWGQQLLYLKSFHKEDVLRPLLRICNDFRVYACILNQLAWITGLSHENPPQQVSKLSLMKTSWRSCHTVDFLLTGFRVRSDTAFLTNAHVVGVAVVMTMMPPQWPPFASEKHLCLRSSRAYDPIDQSELSPRNWALRCSLKHTHFSYSRILYVTF